MELCYWFRRTIKFHANYKLSLWVLRPRMLTRYIGPN